MSASFLIITSSILVSFIPIYLTFRAEEGFKRYSKLTSLFIAFWLIITYFVGKSEVLNDFESFPPRPLFMLASVFILSLVLVLSKHGDLLVKKISLYTLIGIQSFRFLPEFFLDLAYREGLAPIQMTYHGRNFDILVAVVAVVLYFSQRKIQNSQKIVGFSFTVLGLGLLFNILIIAVLSMPLPFRQFLNEPANTFVVTSPHIWLPTIHVFLALWGHFLLIKKLKTS